MKTVINYLFAVAGSLFLYNCGGSQDSGQEETAESNTDSTEVTITEVWATDTVLRTPESVLYDEGTKTLYVANINEMNAEKKDGDGFISKLSPEGEVVALEWVTGLNDPKGMGVYENTLYVNDINEIAAIDMETGEIKEKYVVEGAKFLNDITVGSDGKVYATDSGTDKIHLLENGQVSTWMEDSTLKRPNGLFMEDNGELLLASANGAFFAPIDTDAKTVGEHWIENIPSADGIAKDEKGNYIVSCWSGEVYYLDKDKGSQKILDTKDQKINSADIWYATDQKTLFVPTFNDNRVVAYKFN